MFVTFRSGNHEFEPMNNIDPKLKLLSVCYGVPVVTAVDPQLPVGLATVSPMFESLLHVYARRSLMPSLVDILPISESFVC